MTRGKVRGLEKLFTTTFSDNVSTKEMELISNLFKIY